MVSTAALLLLITSALSLNARASTDVQLNPGLYLSGIDQKPVMRITTDDVGRSLQIEGPHLPATTLSLTEDHNFDTVTALNSGAVSRDFVRKCTAKPGHAKPCDKSLYDELGHLRVQEGDEFTVSARLEVLSTDSALETQFTTWTRNETMVAQKVKRDVLKWSAPAKTKDPVAL